MRLTVMLALRDLLRDRVFVICNVAVIAGVLVPLLVVFGVKNGVYDALIGRLLSNPATLLITTTGNSAFTAEDAAEVAAWPETGFVTLKTRSIFDFVSVRAEGGRGRQNALLVPSGTGDPTLPAGLGLRPDEAVVTANLAAQLGVGPGDTLQVITQATERPRQLMIPLRVVGVLPAERMSGRSVLTPVGTLDLVEAFYDGYAVPRHGIEEGRPAAERRASFEGMRVFARDLTSLGALQTRLEARFGIGTEARTREVESVLNLGRNLNLALGLTASVASVGLAAALVFGFWGETARKRPTLAVLALLGVGGRRLWLFPVVQALVSALLGLLVSFGLFLAARVAAERLFDTGLTEEGGLVRIEMGEALLIAVAVLAFVAATSAFAAAAAARVDPARVLREGAT